jgi:hypothetical protein
MSSGWQWHFSRPTLQERIIEQIRNAGGEFHGVRNLADSLGNYHAVGELQKMERAGRVTVTRQGCGRGKLATIRLVEEGAQ